MPTTASQRARLAQLIAQDAEPPQAEPGRRDVQVSQEDFRVDDLQELRIAMVMTGGVSLAIWMGGATREFDRVIHADDKGSETYLELLRLTLSLPRVDVITGTSAGGLNGALFAYAITQGTGVASLGPLWADVGALEELLRPPTQANPPSLMRGDDYFLPEIAKAIKALEGRTTVPEEVPMELVITTTLLKPWPRGVPDTFGTIIHDVDHHGEFSFRRGGVDLSPVDDEFDVRRVPDIHKRLALAARCTASFPVAFEASYVPMCDADASADRPNMHGTASFHGSRFVIDGGVLLNRPLRPALRAIFRHPASQQVRRVLAYVVPDPGAGGELEGDKPATAPKLADVTAASFSGIPRNQSVSAELDEITQHNARVDAQRRRRELAVVDLDPDYLARKAYAQYRGFRADLLAGWLLAMLARGFTALELEDVPRKREDRVVPEAPLRERTLLREQLIGHLANLPPGQWPSTGADTAQWFTTVDTVERAAGVVLDLLRRGLAVTDPRAPEFAAQRAALRDLRGKVCAALAAAQATRKPLERTEERNLAEQAVLALRADASQPDEAPKLALSQWATRTLPQVLGDSAQLQPIVEQIAEQLVPAAEAVMKACDAAPARLSARAADTRRYAQALVRHVGVNDPTRRSVTPLQRLLALEVVQLALGGRPILDQRVDLIQISGDAGNGLDRREQADEKLAGLQMAHFGAFYKRSWRANDWMWGRHDAAQRLAQVLLEPARLRQLGYTVEEVIARIDTIAFAGLNADDEQTLRDAGPRMWNTDTAAAELSFLTNDGETPPATIPMCAQAVARRLQLGILRDELPLVRQAIRLDEQAGGAMSQAARKFCDMYDSAERQPREELPARDAIALFGACRVGEEKLAGETGADLLARTGTRTVAVATSAVSGTSSGLPKLVQRPMKALRGLGLMIYLVVQYALEGSRFGAMLATGALFAGAALVGAGLVADLPGILMLVGLGAIFGAVLLAIRRHWKTAAAALLVGLLIGWSLRIVDGIWDCISDKALDRWQPVFTVAGLLIGAYVLGRASFEWPKARRSADAEPTRPG